jgi:hypothetical protein
MKNTKTAPVSTGNSATATVVDMPIKTKHLASQFGIKATALRRVLRSMPEYADGVHTNYRWAEKDPRIAQIKAAIDKQAADKLIRAKAAREALEARAKALETAAKVDAKAKA